MSAAPLQGPMLAIALLFASILTPFGIPPLPPDETIIAAAPDDCLLFAASAGTAQPDKASGNHTEQLLATKQMQAFLGQFGSQLTAALDQLSSQQPQLGPFVGVGKPLIIALLSRPAAFYVEHVELASQQPDVVAGLIVHCGDRKGDVAAAVEALEKMLFAGPAAQAVSDAEVAGVKLRRFAQGPSGEIHWGFKDDYFLFTVGPKAAENLLGRVGGGAKKPAWLVALEKQAGVKRASLIRYLDVKKLFASATPMLPASGPNPKLIWDAAGVSDVTSISGISGFGDKGMVDRLFVNFKDSPQGLFELLAGKPLAADDLKAIPKNAVFAGALRLDPLQVYKKLMAISAKIDPKQAEQNQQQMESTATSMGFSLQDDVLGSFGDVWTAHSLIASGQDQVAGLVLTVSLKNKDKLVKLHTQSMGLLAAAGRHAPITIKEIKVAGKQAWQFEPEKEGGFSAVWTIAANRLIVAGSTDALKAQLERAADSPSLADVPAVASRLKTDAVMVTYQDTKTLVEQSLGQLRLFGPVGIALLGQAGYKLEMPQLPDFKTIAPHVLPRTSTLRVDKGSLVSEAFETVPVFGSVLAAAPAAGISVAIMMPTIQAAREAAQRSQGTNNLKELALGMLNMAQAKKRFVSAIYDKSGKPLLSWRVAILPFVGEEALYAQFHLDEPWDSANNKPLLAKMPRVFVHPRLGNLDGKTVYEVPVGEKTIFHDNQGTPPTDISDGTSKTILIVEADEERAVPWTKPEEFTANYDRPELGLGRRIEDGGFIFARADGSVATLPPQVDPDTLWSFFTRAGGEKESWPAR
ncbi:MAG TPA: DUF1559 domain-containing protein [Pirellulales bacterium]|nr:DUF1559 domain-containing protein [Pirellulales bacterium]